MAEDGSLYMLDKFGYVWRAPKTSAGGYTKDKESLAHLGPGRPLGFHFDAKGNLIVCNAGAVRPSSSSKKVSNPVAGLESSARWIPHAHVHSTKELPHASPAPSERRHGRLRHQKEETNKHANISLENQAKGKL